MKKLLSAVAVVAMIAQPVVVPAFAKEPVKISGPANAKGVTTVAIGSFNVGFIFESVDQTKATGGLMGAFGGTTKAKSELVGVTPEMMQAVTDAAYADFVAQLTSGGYTVLPAGDLFTHATMAKIKSQAVPLDINITLEKKSKGKATYYKPSALPSLLMLPGDFVGSGMSSMGINMAAANSSYALTTYAKQASVGVLNVVYLIDFSDQKRPGFFSFGGLQVNSGLSVAADYSRLTLIAPSGRQSVITMKAPVGVEGEFVEKADASSGTDKALQSGANVAGGLAAVAGLGGMRFGKTRKFEFAAKPGAYEEGAAKAASLASEMLIGRLGTLR